MWVVVIVTDVMEDSSRSYGHGIHHIRFNTQKAAKECLDALRRYCRDGYIIEDVRQ